MSLIIVMNGISINKVLLLDVAIESMRKSKID